MVKRRRLFILVAFLFTCLLLGFQVGSYARGGSTQIVPNKPVTLETEVFSPVPVANTVVPSETNLLVIVSDQKTSTMPNRLLSAWLVVNHPALPKLFWFPLYPVNGRDAREKEGFLAQHFSVEQDSEVGKSFEMELKTLYKIEWNSVLLLETQEIAAIVDRMGGVKMGEERLSGKQALDNVAMAAQGMQEALPAQVQFIRSLCKTRDEVTTRPQEWMPVVEMIAGRVQIQSGEALEEGKHSSMREQIKQLLGTTSPLPCEFVVFTE